MKRKDYQSPTIKVVVLTHRTRLLVGSEKSANGSSSTEDYHRNSNQDW